MPFQEKNLPTPQICLVITPFLTGNVPPGLLDGFTEQSQTHRRKSNTEMENKWDRKKGNRTGEKI